MHMYLLCTCTACGLSNSSVALLQCVTSPACVCLSLPAAGRYHLEVRSVSDPSVALRSLVPMQVLPAPMRTSEIGKVFDDLDKLLQFD